MTEKIKEAPKFAVTTADSQIREYSPDFVKVYANHVNLSITLWDVNITFGEMEDDRDGKSVISQTVRVNMSKELAKVFLGLLAQHITAYEREVGEIILPDIAAINQRVLEQEKTETSKTNVHDSLKKRTRKVDFS